MNCKCNVLLFSVLAKYKKKKEKKKKEMYRIARHLYDPYLLSYSYGNYWPVKIRHYCDGKSKWIYLHKDDPSVRSFSRKEPNECSIDQ